MSDVPARSMKGAERGKRKDGSILFNYSVCAINQHDLRTTYYLNLMHLVLRPFLILFSYIAIFTYHTDNSIPWLITRIHSTILLTSRRIGGRPTIHPLLLWLGVGGDTHRVIRLILSTLIPIMLISDTGSLTGGTKRKMSSSH